MGRALILDNFVTVYQDSILHLANLLNSVLVYRQKILLSQYSVLLNPNAKVISCIDCINAKRRRNRGPLGTPKILQ